VADQKGARGRVPEYWSKRSTVPDRSGLIGDFLSRVESRNEFPWITWELDERWTTFVNVGLWREGADFQQQFGRFIDDTRPLMTFEAARRRRVLVAPQRWRGGGTAFPASVRLRQIFPQEMPLLLESSGLELAARHGDFAGNPLTGQSLNQVCLARPPATSPAVRSRVTAWPAPLRRRHASCHRLMRWRDRLRS
jgi:hypothetical protein